MIDFLPQKLLVLNSRLKLQIFEKEVFKNEPQGCPMTHMPRNEGEILNQTALAGKRKVFVISFEDVQSDQNAKAR